MNTNKRAWLLAYLLPALLVNFSLILEIFGPFLESFGNTFGLLVYVLGTFILNVITFKIFGIYFVLLNTFFIYKKWDSIMNHFSIGNKLAPLLIYSFIFGAIMPIFGVFIVSLYLLGNNAGLADYISQSFLLSYFSGTILSAFVFSFLPYKTIIHNSEKNYPVYFLVSQRIAISLIASICSFALPFTLFVGLWEDVRQSLFHSVSIFNLSDQKKETVLRQEYFFKKPILFREDITLHNDSEPTILWIDNNRFFLTAFQGTDTNRILVDITNSSTKSVPLENGSHLNEYKICFDGTNLKSIFQKRFGITWKGEDFQNKEVIDLLSNGGQSLDSQDIDEYSCKKWKDINSPLKYLKSKDVEVSNVIVVPWNDIRGKYFTGGYAVQETDMYHARWFSSSGEEKEQKILYRPWYVDRYSAGLSGMYVDTKFIPVKNGYVVRDRNMDAVYLIKNDNTYTKIIDGHVMGLDFVVDGDDYLRVRDGFYITTSVSPNGCYVAFGFQKPQDPYVSEVKPVKDFILTVLNICQE